MDKSKFLISAAPVARAVTFTDGSVETLHFKQLNAGQVRRWRMDEQSGDPATIMYAMQKLVAQSLCDENGKLALTEAEAVGLTASGLQDLFPHVIAVSGLEPAAKKDSPSADANGSDASSP